MPMRIQIQLSYDKFLWSEVYYTNDNLYNGAAQDKHKKLWDYRRRLFGSGITSPQSRISFFGVKRSSFYVQPSELGLQQPLTGFIPFDLTGNTVQADVASTCICVREENGPTAFSLHYLAGMPDDVEAGSANILFSAYPGWTANWNNWIDLFKGGSDYGSMIAANTFSEAATNCRPQTPGLLQITGPLAPPPVGTLVKLKGMVTNPIYGRLNRRTRVVAVDNINPLTFYVKAPRNCPTDWVAVIYPQVSTVAFVFTASSGMFVNALTHRKRGNRSFGAPHGASKKLT